MLLLYFFLVSFMVNPDEEVPVNEQSLFAEMGESNTFEFSGIHTCRRM